MSVSSDGTGFVLPRGVTGYRHCRDAPLPSTDSNRFHTDALRVIERLPARIVAGTSQTCGLGVSYHSIEIFIGYQNVIAMLNSVHPLVGFALEEDGYLNFIDQAELTSGFAVFGRYEVLGETVLKQAVTSREASDLAEAEIYQMKYWQPQTVGEVIFNRWA